VIGKFLRIWADRHKTMVEYSQQTFSSPSTTDNGGVAGASINLSKRLIAVTKSKNVHHIESGLEMIALAMVISAEVRNIDSFQICLFFTLLQNNGIFPELAADVKTVLRRFAFTLHFCPLIKSLKNLVRSYGTLAAR
jgi:ABC-type uncharacterized transport system permease subunit